VINAFKYSGSEKAGVYLRYAPLFLWIAVIFYMSSGAGSFEQTSGFIGPLLAFLFPNAPPETIASYHGFIRKCAHFVVYGMLAFFAHMAFVRWPRWPAIVLGVVALVAILDELNQSYNKARTGAAADVMLDFAGGLFAFALVWFTAHRRLSRG